MPPKKKAALGAKSGDKEARLETEVASLQRLLEIRSCETVAARRCEQERRAEAAAAAEALAQTRVDMLDVKADMLRKYQARSWAERTRAG